MLAGESIVLCTWLEFLTFATTVKNENTGVVQEPCPLCASIATHIVRVEGSTVGKIISSNVQLLLFLS
jgi:hypothetical protein